MNIGQGKVFERPNGGSYLGTIIDVVDMPAFPTRYGPKDKVRVLWVLSHINGVAYLDSEGAPMTIAGFYNATQTDNSNLTKVLRQILNGQPPLINNTEDLSRLLLGRSNQLFLTQEPDQKKVGEFMTLVAGIAPLPPLPAGVKPPQVPAGFVRFKDKPKTQAGPQSQPVQTYAQPPQSQQANPQSNNVSFAAARPTSNPEAF
jgi:hypothetical protein